MSSFRLFLSLLTAARDLLYPPCCLGCGRQLESSRLPLFCGPCSGQLLFTGPPWCSCCGLPFAAGRADHLCGDCLKNRFVFDLARSALAYQPPVRQLIIDLKFRQRLAALASLTALALASDAMLALAEPDLILPVPLHPARLRRRGFNQALLIARGCFPSLRSRIVPDLLVRVRNTRSQTGLSGAERRRNLDGAFAVKTPGIVESRRILLIDDVFTTGSTVNSCGAVLRQAGAARIEVFTLARAI